MGAGEIYLDGKKRSDIEKCKESCENEKECQSITLYSSGWCSHFSTPCAKTKKAGKGSVSWTMIKIPGGSNSLYTRIVSVWAERPYIKHSCNSQTCTHAHALIPSTTVFKPKSKKELQAAVDACIGISADGNCTKGPHGPIEEWDVSEVTDMSDLFKGAALFNSDISKWNVSSVTRMHSMFYGATSFSQTLCGAWSASTANKFEIFKDSSGRLCSGSLGTAHRPNYKDTLTEQCVYVCFFNC